MPFESNLDDVLGELEELTLTRDAEAEVTNSADYARPLHELEGYYVFNPEHFQETVYRHLQEADSFSDEDVLAALEAAGESEVEWLRATSPPGGWTQRSGHLADSYDSDARHIS